MSHPSQRFWDACRQGAVKLLLMNGAKRVMTAAAALSLLLVAPMPAGADSSGGSPPTPLQRVVSRLGEEANYFDPSGIIGISVVRLDTGEEATFQGDRWLKAASGLKATWMVAAIRRSGIEAVEPLAVAVFGQSSNDAGGLAIGLGGGLDAINSFTSGLGMKETLVVEWTFGSEWRSSDFPGPHPYLNFTTADDLAAFWRLVYDGWVLSAADTNTFLEWGRIERLPGYPSGLLTRLPPDVWSGVSFKMGWLPPGRTEEDEETGEIVEVDALDTLIGSGVVEVPDGPVYALAIGSFGGTSWSGKVAFVAYAACRIHETIIGEDLACDRPGDPHRVRADTDPPIGGLHSVEGTAGFLEVRGWAVDPDDISGHVLVRFTVDGFWTGSDRANERHSWGGDAFIVDPGHGFGDTLLVELSPGPHEVCAVAINDGDGRDTGIGCLSVVVR